MISSFYTRLFFLALGVLFFLQALVRCDVQHFVPTFLPAIIVSGLVLTDVLYRPVRKQRFVAYLVSILLIAASAFSAQRSAFLYRLKLIAETATGEQHCRLPDRARGIRVDGDCGDYALLVQFVRDSVPNDDKIFVGNTRHDRIVKNDILLYFLADRECAVRYHELHPGLATTAAVQQEIIEDIRKSRVRFVILSDIQGNEPNESSVSSGVFLLDDYLRQTFPIIRQIGRYSVGRFDSACARVSASKDENQLNQSTSLE